MFVSGKRKKKRNETWQEKELKKIVDTSTEANPEMGMRLVDIRKMIDKAQREHPDNTALMFVWTHFYEGATISAVAAEMGTNERTAASRLARAAKFMGNYIRGAEK